MKVNGKPIKARSYDIAAVNAMTGEGIHPVLARVYASRGLTSADLSLSAAGLPAKETLEGCTDAGAMLADAITGKKRIIAVADFDSDGASSAAVMLRGISKLGGDIDFLVPDRKKGYGLSPDLARAAKDMGGEVIVTVDNGVSAFAGIEEARKLNLQTLVTDHHLQGATLPNADIIVNPNLKSSQFASKALAGVGVAFYVMAAARDELRRRQWTHDLNMASLLDLVAVGTVGDLVALDRTNRTLVNLGLQRIRGGKTIPGIQALMSIANKNPLTANSETIGFALAPRINAAGRLATADIGIRMLASDNMGEALMLAKQLDDINGERKQIQMEMTEAAIEELESFEMDGRKSLVVFDESFHEGVIGLVASRLKEKYHLPSVAFAIAEGGYLKGSCRSIPGIHIRDVLELVSKREQGLIMAFGGHAMAAGLSIDGNGLARFENAFEDAVLELAAENAFSPEMDFDGELEAHHFTLGLAEQIRSENWGQAFPAPTFRGKFNVFSQKNVGTGHLKLGLLVDDEVVDAIFFGRGYPVGKEIDAIYRLDVNEWNGEKKLQLVIEGIEDEAVNLDFAF